MALRHFCATIPSEVRDGSRCSSTAFDADHRLPWPRQGSDPGHGRSGQARRLMGRFKDSLAQGGLRAIAEVKRRSPSAGDLRPDADPAALAKAFQDNGAAAVSILVDERFGGTFDDLAAARATTTVPLLAKGFFDDQGDLLQARIAGADAALLLLRDLDDEQARLMLGGAHELGLDLLVEAHDAEELARAIALDAGIIGINARDLGTFEIDRRTQLGLVADAPRDRVIVAESAIGNRAQGAEAELAGADAILVGSTLMRADDPGAKLAGLLARPLVKVCGLTREEDVAVAAEAGRRPRRIRPRREPAPRRGPATRARDDALGRSLRRRGGGCGHRPRPALPGGGRPPRPQRRPAPGRRDRGDRARPPLARQRRAPLGRGGGRGRPHSARGRPRPRERPRRRSRRSVPGPSTPAGASSARRGSRTTGRCARSSRPPGPRRCPHERHRVRRLRRPVRPRDPHARARRARARLAGDQGRSRHSPPSLPTYIAPTSAARRRSTWPSASATAAASTSSARTSATPVRTRSTTPSARP